MCFLKNRNQILILNHNYDVHGLKYSDYQMRNKSVEEKFEKHFIKYLLIIYALLLMLYCSKR